MALRTFTHPTTLKRPARLLPDNARGCQFRSADLDVEVRDGQLVIVGKGGSEEQYNQFLHRGIAAVLSDVFSLRTMSR